MQEYLLLERSADGHVIRSGVIEGDHTGATLRVRWEGETTTEELRFDGRRHVRVAKRSLSHLALVDSEHLQKRLLDDPASLFLQRLRETGRAMNGADLRSDLQGLRLSTTAVSSAWKRSRQKLGKTDGIVTRGEGTKKTFQWRPAKDGATTADSAESQLVREPVNAPPNLDGAQTARQMDLAAWDSKDGASDPPREPGALPERILSADGPSHEVVPYEKKGPDGGAATLSSPKTELSHALNLTRQGLASLIDELADGDPGQSVDRVLGQKRSHALPSVAFAAVALLAGHIVAEDDIRFLERTPLKSAAFLDSLKESTLARLHTTASENEVRPMIGALRCVPKSDANLKELRLTPLPDIELRRLVMRADSELRRLGNGVPPEIHRSVRQLSSHVLHTPNDRHIDVITLLTVGRWLLEAGEGKSGSDRELRSLLADRLTATIRVSSRSEELSGEQLDVIRRLLEPLPFNMKGGRSGLLAVLARHYPPQLSDGRWWRGMTVDHLAVESHGDLGRALSQPEIGETVVAPMIKHHLDSASSRRQLSWALECPPVVADHIRPTTLVQALQRCTSFDPWFAEVINILGQTARIAALESDIECLRTEIQAAREDVDEANRQREDAVTQARREQEKALTAQREMRTIHDDHEQIRAAEDRQLRIDSMRAVAAIATTVEAGLGTLSPSQLRMRLHAVMERHDVEPLGQPGDLTSFDPDHHDPAEPLIGRGDPVEIVRVGWLWHVETGQEVVLQRALVARITVEETR